MSADIIQFVAIMDQPNRIRELRLQANLSQQTLADRIGTAKATISSLESGKMQLTLEYMRRIARALSVTVTDVLPHSDVPDQLSLDERRFFVSLRAATSEQRAQVLRLAEVVLPVEREANEPQRYARRGST